MDFIVALLPRDRSVRAAIWFLFGALFLKNLIIIAIVPIWQGTDEGTNFAYVQYIAEERSIPVYTMPYRHYQIDNSKEQLLSQKLNDSGHVQGDPFAIQRFLYVQDSSPRGFTLLPPSERRFDRATYRNQALSNSPLYFGLAAIPYYIAYKLPIEYRVLAIRVATSLLMIPFCLFAFAFLRELLESEPAALLASAFAVFQPMFGYIFCIVNNDALLITCGAGAFCFMSLYLSGGSKASVIATGVAIGLAGLAKTQGLFLLGIWPMFIAGRFLLKREVDWAGAAKSFAVAVIILAPWVAFTKYHYGQWLSAGPTSYLVESVNSKYPPPTFVQVITPLFYRWPDTVFISFWGNFGFLDTPIGQGVKNFIWYCFVVSSVAVPLALVMSVIKKGIRTSTGALFFLSFISLYLFDMMFGFFLFPYMSYADGQQGRYYFVSWILMVAILFYSLKILVPEKYLNRIYASLVAAMALFCLYAVYAVIIPRYYL